MIMLFISILLKLYLIKIYRIIFNYLHLKFLNLVHVYSCLFFSECAFNIAYLLHTILKKIYNSSFYILTHS